MNKEVLGRAIRRWAGRLVGMAVVLTAGPVFGQPPDAQTLWASASLYRDEWGVPHVYAEDPRALAFAFGYAQAEDHLEAMLLAYRIANGRAAEVLGESHASSDAFSLKMGHARIAREAIGQVDPVTRELCEGFAQGVNAWLVDFPAKAPEWAEGVQPPDILALWHALIVSMAPLDLPGVDRPPRAFDTGNAWALSPARTVEGVGMLVMNAHEYHDGPFRWYEAHLVCQDYNMAGASLFGLPIIVQGHNNVLGWALTPNEADFADVFQESIGAGGDNGRNFERREGPSMAQSALLAYMAQSQPYYVRTASGLEERFVPAMINSRGPVFEDGGGLYSWKMGGFLDFGGLYQLWEMGRSTGLSAFQEAVSMHQLPCFHIVYADHAGTLFYQYNVKCGVRAATEGISEQQQAQGNALDWKSPVTTDFEFYGWRTVLPPETLPWMVNPERGYVQACGNPPWFATDDAPLRADQWPAWLITDADSHRARRVRQLLRAGRRTFTDMHAMLFDAVAGAAVNLTPRLIAAAEQRADWVAAAHPDLAAAIELLRAWNYLADVNAPGMTFYHAWWLMIREQTAGHLGDDIARYEYLMSNDPVAQQLALDAAAGAVRMMRNEFQSISVPWGEAHRIERGGREEPAAGAVSGGPLLLASDDDFRDGRWFARYGYGFAMAVLFTETPEAYSLVPFGASENKTSPHFADQMPLLLEKRLKRARFEQREVWHHAQTARGRTLYLSPLGVEGTIQFDAMTCIEARVTASLEAPAPLPEGWTAFTLFIRPEWAPEAVPVRTSMEIYVPGILCEGEHLTRLSIHAYVKDDGWYSLSEQEVDSEQRVFSGGYDGNAVYAVLGPTECLLSPPAAGGALPAVPPRGTATSGSGIFAPGMPGAAPSREPVAAPFAPPNAVDAAVQHSPQMSSPRDNPVQEPFSGQSPSVPQNPGVSPEAKEHSSRQKSQSSTSQGASPRARRNFTPRKKAVEKR